MHAWIFRDRLLKMSHISPNNIFSGRTGQDPDSMVFLEQKTRERRAVYVQEYITIPLGEKEPLYSGTGADIL